MRSSTSLSFRAFPLNRSHCLRFNQTVMIICFMLLAAAQTALADSHQRIDVLDEEASSAGKMLRERRFLQAVGDTAAAPEGYCLCSDCNEAPTAQEPLELQILVVDSPGIITMVKWNADNYYNFTNGRVKININLVPTMTQLFEEIENDARDGGSLFDAYYTNPVLLGTAAIAGGLLDLTDFIKESPYADWPDVFIALRNYATTFEEKTYIVLLDGDTHTLFYRKDVLAEFGLQVPRTWNEYIEVAKAIHGRSFNGTIMSGSCVSRIKGDHALYWYHLVLSTITQTRGTSEGSLFDPQDMTPLTGNALAEMLRIHEEMSKYGTDDEYSDIINHVQNGHMNDGTCAMTFMWGDLFRRSKAEGSILHDRLGIAPTPGSEFVLDRSTGELVRCDKERCPHNHFYEDIGFVNSAPYAANGGWGGAISAHTTREKQEVLAEFFLWASSIEQSEQYVIPNATLPWIEINGQDPFRKSQLDVEKWVKQGFGREVSKQYVQSILSNLLSKNVVVEIRFPKAGEIMTVLDTDVNEYLVRAKYDLIPEADRAKERLRTAQHITDQWVEIIRSYDARGDTVVPILEIYQRLRGVFVPNEDKNFLIFVRPVGYFLVATIWFVSVALAIWVYVKRSHVIVRTSQPPFLWLICAGTTVMSTSIIVMGVDESIASVKGCSAACMMVPWFVSVGFTLTFAALCSKILRLKRLMKSAFSFQRIKVRSVDVLLPFISLLGINMVAHLTWTFVDPLMWTRTLAGRRENGEITSIGTCEAEGTLGDVLSRIASAVNTLALVAANVLAYQTRGLNVDFNESKYIGLAMASILQATVIGIPILFLAESNPVALYLVRALLVSAICLSVLAFVFYPKVMIGREDSRIVSARILQSNFFNEQTQGSRRNLNSTWSMGMSAPLSRPFGREPPSRVLGEPTFGKTPKNRFDGSTESSSGGHLSARETIETIDGGRRKSKVTFQGSSSGVEAETEEIVGVERQSKGCSNDGESIDEAEGPVETEDLTAIQQERQREECSTNDGESIDEAEGPVESEDLTAIQRESQREECSTSDGESIDEAEDPVESEDLTAIQREGQCEECPTNDGESIGEVEGPAKAEGLVVIQRDIQSEECSNNGESIDEVGGPAEAE